MVLGRGGRWIREEIEMVLSSFLFNHKLSCKLSDIFFRATVASFSYPQQVATSSELSTLHTCAVYVT